MATFAAENAKINEIYIRRVLAGGNEKYLRLPFNLVRYDDGEEYIEPIPALGAGGANQQFSVIYNAENDGEFLIVDKPPFNELFQLF